MDLVESSVQLRVVREFICMSWHAMPIKECFFGL